MDMGFKLAVCQLKVREDKKNNISKAISMIKAAANNNSDVVVLPEMFNCPYNSNVFNKYSENVKSGETINAISKLAKELGIYIFAGSIPESCEGKLYNTCFVINRKGEIIGRHRKMHLFDINVEGEIRFRESDSLTAGNEVTVVDTEFCKIGVAICYDMRFPELVRLMALKGAKIIIVPAAFNMTTGPAHWELLIRTRAVDNQVYMVAASPARDKESLYIAYGNSMIVEPWGTILQKAGENEEIIYSNIELSRVDKVRSELPLLEHRRKDIYDLVER